MRKILSRIREGCAACWWLKHLLPTTTMQILRIHSLVCGAQFSGKCAGKPLQRPRVVPAPAPSPTPLYESGDPQSGSQQSQPLAGTFATRKREKVQSSRTSDCSFYSARQRDFGMDPPRRMIQMRTCALADELLSEHASSQKLTYVYIQSPQPTPTAEPTG